VRWEPTLTALTIRHRYRLSDAVRAVCRLLGAGSYTTDTVGWDVWEGATDLLAHHIVQHPELVRGKRILEIGAGVGVVGMVSKRNVPPQREPEVSCCDCQTTGASRTSRFNPQVAAKCGAHSVVISDYDEGALAIANANIDINGLSHICWAVKYDWSTDSIPSSARPPLEDGEGETRDGTEAFDLVLASGACVRSTRQKIGIGGVRVRYRKSDLHIVTLWTIGASSLSSTCTVETTRAFEASARHGADRTCTQTSSTVLRLQHPCHAPLSP
jgi:hypothetical protein